MTLYKKCHNSEASNHSDSDGLVFKSALYDNLRVGRLFESIPEMMACQSACNRITCLSFVNAAK